MGTPADTSAYLLKLWTKTMITLRGQRMGQIMQATLIPSKRSLLRLRDSRLLVSWDRLLCSRNAEVFGCTKMNDRLGDSQFEELHGGNYPVWTQVDSSIVEESSTLPGIPISLMHRFNQQELGAISVLQVLYYLYRNS